TCSPPGRRTWMPQAGAWSASINRPVECRAFAGPAARLSSPPLSTQRVMAAPPVPLRPPPRKPAWLKVVAPVGPNYLAVKQLIGDLRLHTVCQEAHCPNIGEC